MLLRASALLLVGGLLLLAASYVPLATGPEGVAVMATATPAISELELAQQGRALFRAKGCLMCHQHGAIEPPTFTPGADPDGPPELTDYQPDPAFVRQWLRNPDAVRPGVAMPNLELSEEEITALIAFLAAPLASGE
jgi:cytochrome c2